MKKFVEGMVICFALGFMLSACTSTPATAHWNPAMGIGGTSWEGLDGIIKYTFNNDDSFKIDWPPEYDGMKRMWGIDLEGTYTIEGNEVTLNFESNRSLSYKRTANGDIGMSNQGPNPRSFLLRGDEFTLDDAIFRLLR